MQNLALPAEVASPSPEPSRARYQEIWLPFTQRDSPWGRAAKNKACEGIFNACILFHPVLAELKSITKTKVTTTISFLFLGCPTQRSS